MKLRTGMGMVMCLSIAVTIGGLRCHEQEATRMDGHALSSRTVPFRSKQERGVTKSSVVVSRGSTTSDFNVTFIGVITVAKLDPAGGVSTARRAILLEGDSGMPHLPLLIVDAPTNSGQLATLKSELALYTDSTPDCSNSNYPDRCVVRLKGVDLRIRGEGGVENSFVLGTLGEDASFDCIVPHLKAIANIPSGGNSTHTDIPITFRNGDLPKSPAEAYFEIEGGGQLAACPFKIGGFYGGQPQSSCHQFASDVYWTGKTKQVAVLQVRSTKTSNQWKTLSITNPGELDIVLSNEPPSRIGMTSGHFVLYNKVLGGGTVPMITSCTVQHPCVLCSNPQVVIPGCSDTQWP